MNPQRIQRSRRAGSRLPDGAVCVTRGAAVPDPPVKFDRIVLVLAGVDVSVAGVVETLSARHSMAEVARLFSVSEAHVEAAIRWHVQQGKKRRRR